MLRKLGLSEKFPKELLYAQRGALGVSLITPKTAIAIAIVKLYIGNMQQQSNVVNLIKMNKEYNHILMGLSKYPISLGNDSSYWK